MLQRWGAFGPPDIAGGIMSYDESCRSGRSGEPNVPQLCSIIMLHIHTRRSSTCDRNNTWHVSGKCVCVWRWRVLAQICCCVQEL